MRSWECVLLYCVFVINPPSCSTVSIQQQTQTPLPVSTLHAADAGVDASGKAVQDQKQKRDFPGGKGPIDPLSIRLITGSRKRRPGDQITIALNRSVDPTEKSSNATNQEKLEIPVSTTPTNAQKNPSDVTRAIVPGARTGFVLPVRKPSVRIRTIKQGFVTPFGLPVDNVGLRPLPGRRRH